MLAQTVNRVGDITGNLREMVKTIGRAESAGMDLLVFPELALTGYPPEDLLLRDAFLDAVEIAVKEVTEATGKTVVVFGHPRRTGRGLCNSASLVRYGSLCGIYDKRALPNYGVFDERRYFVPGEESKVVEIGMWRIGIGICEDLWDDAIAEETCESACDVLLNLNASPFHVGKQAEREALLRKRARQFGTPILYVNPVGGQDEVVFDGGSHAVDADGMLLARAPMFESACISVDLADLAPTEIAVMPEPIEQIRLALVTGVRDYVRRNGCRQVLLGLSGGVDSAVTAVVAVQALGVENVLGVLMPSCFSSEHSVSDAHDLAGNLGIETVTLPIDPPVSAVEQILAEPFDTMGLSERDVTEENIQARVRGLLLMAISNKTGRMLLSTGNKSEMAVGYATLYGDMAGGFAVLKDVYKMQVFELAHYINRKGIRIPENSISKPPSAELRPDQKDSDSLPDYTVLDAILKAYIEDRMRPDDIVSQGFDGSAVKRIVGMLHRAEYKRRQAPPGVKITQKAFGRDRRYPITHGFRDWLAQV